jgi:hypothetical protein
MMSLARTQEEGKNNQFDLVQQALTEHSLVFNNGLIGGVELLSCFCLHERRYWTERNNEKGRLGCKVANSMSEILSIL